MTVLVMVAIHWMVTIPGMVTVLEVLIIIEYVKLSCMTLSNLMALSTKLFYKLTGTDRRTNLGIGRYVPPNIMEPMQEAV